MDKLIVGVGNRGFQQKLEQLCLQPDASLYLFQHGGEALCCVEQYTPGLIVADYRLPDIDGLSFMYRVGQIAPGAQRILYGLDNTFQQQIPLFACVIGDGLAQAVSRAGFSGYAWQIGHTDPEVLRGNSVSVDSERTFVR